MSSSSYQSQQISAIELTILSISNCIGVGVLSMPRPISEFTLFSDGWVVLTISGLVSTLMVWTTATLSSRFPNQSFLSYTSNLISKPIALFLILLASSIFLCVAAYEARSISLIVNIYLLKDARVELLSFCFLLCVAYGLIGSRIAFLRLHVGTLWIVLILLLILILSTIHLWDITRLFPTLQTTPLNYIKAVKHNAPTFLGFEIILFYSYMVKNTNKIPHYLVLGMMSLTIIYILIYFVCVGVMSEPVLCSLTYPLIELGKMVEFPNGFIERLDAFFFTGWIVTIFSTTAMYIDGALIAICSTFPNVPKRIFLFILMPIVYLISLFLYKSQTLNQFGYILSLIDCIFIMIIPFTLLIISYIKTNKE